MRHVRVEPEGFKRKFLENLDNFPKGAKTAPLDNAPDTQTIRNAARQGVPF